MRTVSVGFLGCGNIGCGVWKLLNEFKDDIAHRADVQFDIRRILVRDIHKKRDQHRYNALEEISDKCNDRRTLSDTSENIGKACVSAAHFSDILMLHEPGHDY